MNRFDSKLCIKYYTIHMRNRKNTLKASELTERFMLHEMCVCGEGGGVRTVGPDQYCKLTNLGLICLHILFLIESLGSGTVNPEIFARILFSRIALKDEFAIERFRDYVWFTYIDNFAISRGNFIFTKLRICMRSIAKINNRENFRPYCIQRPVPRNTHTRTRTHARTHTLGCKIN